MLMSLDIRTCKRMFLNYLKMMLWLILVSVCSRLKARRHVFPYLQRKIVLKNQQTIIKCRQLRGFVGQESN